MRFTQNLSKIWQTVLYVSFAVYFASCSSNEQKPAEDVVSQDSVPPVQVNMRYGLPVDEYNVKYDTLRARQTLAEVLYKYGLTANQIHQLTQCPDTIFNVRRLRPGQSFALFYDKDSTSAPRYFVYEENLKNYVVFSMADGCAAQRFTNPSQWIVQEATGKVKSSLWMAMKDAGISVNLAVEMSNIFGWSVDFFGIQKDDEFRLIFEREFVGDEPLNNFRVRAASFCASDSVVYAIPFVQDDEELFYNVDGNSLEGAFLKAPLDYYRISSKFSNSRYHPVLKKYRAHHGVDYAAPAGTPVYAIGNGKVIKKGYQAGGGGNYIKIRHNNSAYVTTYMHLSRFAKGLKEGDVVRQKQVIGYVGSTGISTGPHLDFRVHENGKPINPLTIKSQPKKPISEENRAAFNQLADSLVKRLLAIPESIPETECGDSLTNDSIKLME